MHKNQVSYVDYGCSQYMVKCNEYVITRNGPMNKGEIFANNNKIYVECTDDVILSLSLSKVLSTFLVCVKRERVPYSKQLVQNNNLEMQAK